ncbi:helix-turn-helix domain-containing protein [Gemmiger sp.]
MTFSDKLIALRRKAGWSQEELAERLNVSRQSVSKWESAQSMPDIDKIVQLSSLFSVTTDYLLKDGRDDPQPAAAATPSPLPRIKALTAAYWLVVVAIFLWYTFGPNGNGQPQYSWFIWAIAGVVYAACVVAAKAFVRKKE